MDPRSADFPPKDKWRLYVDSLPPEDGQQGFPAGLINLEVIIRRRVVIPTDLGSEDVAEVSRALTALGLEDVSAIFEAVKGLSPQQRKYVSAGWTDAADGQFDDRSVSELCKMAGARITWRLEGDPSPAGAIFAVLSSGGYEQRVRITRDTVEEVDEYWVVARDEAEKIKDNPGSTPAKRDAARVAVAIGICMVGVGGGLAAKNAGAILTGAVACFEAYDAMMDTLEEEKRRQAEAEAETAGRATGREPTFRGGENDFRRAGGGMIG